MIVMLICLQEDCDLIIRVDEKEIPVHKTFLMMRSKFFKTIISRWLPKESNEKYVSITIANIF